MEFDLFEKMEQWSNDCSDDSFEYTCNTRFMLDSLICEPAKGQQIRGFRLLYQDIPIDDIKQKQIIKYEKNPFLNIFNTILKHGRDSVFYTVYANYDNGSFRKLKLYDYYTPKWWHGEDEDDGVDSRFILISRQKAIKVTANNDPRIYGLLATK